MNQSGQTIEEFQQSWGYRGLEKAFAYQKRTARYAGLMAAIWITYKRRDEHAPHPFGIDHGWKFLTDVFNSPPEPMYLHVLDKIFVIAGSTLHAAYGKQFVKMMFVLRDRYLPAVSTKIDDDTKPVIDRLRNERVKTFFEENRFPDPTGKLVVNYW